MNKLFLGKPQKEIEDFILNNYYTIYIVQTTSDYKKTGIYYAQQNNTNKPIIVNWGDGMVEHINGDINQKVHEYASASSFTVKVFNIKSFAASANDYDWYNNASQNRYTLRQLSKLNSSVSYIGDYAFRSCSNFTNVSIRANVSSIGTQAFYYCESLEHVSIPKGVTSIGEMSFSGCANLTTVSIDSNSNLQIGNSAFSDCQSIENIVFNNKTTAEVQQMQNYPWGIEDTNVIHGSLG